SDTTLIHVAEPNNSGQVAWVDASGHFSDPILRPAGNIGSLDLSFDGSRLVTTRTDRTTGAPSLWITELEGVGDKYFAPGNNAIFSPTGPVIVAGSPPPQGLQRIDLNTGERQLLNAFGWPTDWSSDGRLLIVEQPTAKTQYDL